MAAPLKILVADDEPLAAMAVQSQLLELGHEVVGPASNGREAIDLARQRRPDLAILDVRMPGTSGLEAAREICREHPIPIILLTGYSDEESIRQAARGPIMQYLVKPVAPEDLRPAIEVARVRFEERQRLAHEATALERRIQERKVVEQAKGVLMTARGLSEREAYRLLQKESQNRNQPMAEIARTILAADVLLRGPTSAP